MEKLSKRHQLRSPGIRKTPHQMKERERDNGRQGTCPTGHGVQCASRQDARKIAITTSSKVKKEKTGGMTTVSMDYATIGDREDEADARKILVGKDRWTRSVFCHLVKCKGLGDGKIVDKIVKSVAEMGHTKIRLKTDGEPALVQVQGRVIEVRTHSTTPDNPPAHDPQSNGEAERAVQEVKAQMGATVLALESRLDSKVDSRWPVIEWVVPHAAGTVNRFLVGNDGRTAYYTVCTRRTSTARSSSSENR